MTSFLSTFVNKVDRKGRVSVPAPFRAAARVGRSRRPVTDVPDEWSSPADAGTEPGLQAVWRILLFEGFYFADTRPAQDRVSY